MTGPAVLGLPVPLIPGAPGLLDRKKAWWRFRAGNHAHPERNEPSAGALRRQRIAPIRCSRESVTLFVRLMATAPSPS
ncbi:hypothetical protein M2169_001613 [Streptomyces sp. MJP52]|nr:hypothetical protein [Streptomyces sp. MJP52]